MADWSNRGVDSVYAWIVALASLFLAATGAGVYFLVGIAIVPRAEELGIAVKSASLPYGVAMLGMGIGGIAMGWFADRRGPFLPAVLGSLSIAGGAYWVSVAPDFGTILLVYALLLGALGNAALVTPLFAAATRWFERRRGVAASVVGSGNALGGAIWPQVFHWSITTYGFAWTFQTYALFALVTMLPLCFVLRPRPPEHSDTFDSAQTEDRAQHVFGLAPNTIVVLLCAAVVGCCTAMSMPLVHLPRYVVEQGFTLGDGARMLGVLMATSMVARILWGFVCDRIGGLPTLFVTSATQAVGLAGIAAVDGHAALYGTAMLFGLGFGGILPCYPVILREDLAPEGLGWRVGLIVLFGAIGMAIGPEIAGRSFAHSGSYSLGFAAGVGANLVNLTIVGVLNFRRMRAPALPLPA